ncbi:MAG: DMT family transporter [Alphaproteobacteria bacterium]
MSRLHSVFALLVCLIWSGNFVASKFGMQYFTPFMFTALRFAIVAVLLVPFVPRPNKKQFLQLLLLATAFGVLHFGLILASLYKGLDIAGCAIAAQMGVPFSCILGALFLQDNLGWKRSMGMAVSFVGMFIVAGTPNVLENMLGFILALGAAFSWAVGNLLTKRLASLSVFQMLGWMSLLAVPQLLAISWFTESNAWKPLVEAPLPIWLFVSYTALGSTIVAYGLWYFLLKRYPISYVAPYSLLTPLFSIALGQIFFVEQLTWHILLGGALTIGGVAVIVIRRPKTVMLGKPE